MHEGDDWDGWNALLDTMTNVVGLLVMVLAVVYLGTGDAFRRVEKLKPVPRETMAARVARAQRQDAEADRELASLDDQWRVLQQRLAAREVAAAAPSLDLPSLPDVPPGAGGANQGTDRQLEQKYQFLLADTSALERLAQELRKQLLLQAPVPMPKVTIARVPDPTPAPVDATPLVFACRYGHVLPMDFDALSKTLRAGIAAASPRAAIEPADFSRVSRYFDDNVIGIKPFRWRLQASTQVGGADTHVRRDLVAVLDWTDRMAGDGIDDIQRPSSTFRHIIERASKSKSYGKFYVWGDSFPEYTVARDVLEAQNIPAGWTPEGGDLTYHVIASTTVAELATPMEHFSTSHATLLQPRIIFRAGGTGNGVPGPIGGGGRTGGGGGAGGGAGSAGGGGGGGGDSVD